MSLQKMELAHLPQVLALQKELAFQDWNERQFISEINASYAYCVVYTADEISVAENKDSNILGYAIFHLMGPDSELLSIAVKPQVQRSGIGAILLEAGFSQLDFSSGDCCFLEVREGNLKARNFYEKNGFTLFGTRKKYYSDGENAILYKREQR